MSGYHAHDRDELAAVTRRTRARPGGEELPVLTHTQREPAMAAHSRQPESFAVRRPRLALEHPPRHGQAL